MDACTNAAGLVNPETRMTAEQPLSTVDPDCSRELALLTPGHWLQHWLATRLRPRPRTLRGYDQHIRQQPIPYFGEILLHDLCLGDVQSVFATLARTPSSAVNIRHSRVDELAPTLLPDPDARIVVYCGSATFDASLRVAQRLHRLGYPNVDCYTAGRHDWITAGLPIEHDQPANPTPGVIVVTPTSTPAPLGSARVSARAAPPRYRGGRSCTVVVASTPAAIPWPAWW